MKRVINFLLLCLLTQMPVKMFAQNGYPAEVNAAIRQTKTNQKELIKALSYFYKTGDNLKIKSINFLVANMPIHFSSNYYWADSKGKKIPYDELSYHTYNDAVDGLEELKKKYGKLHPVPYDYRDIDSITGDFLIENVELAVGEYRKRQKEGRLISEEEFFEYILPYRVSNEPLQSWRKIYSARYANQFTTNQQSSKNLLQLKQTIKNELKNLWAIENKTEPLPRLSAMQILLRKKGYCEDIADMATFISRSRGIASAIDNIPVWGTTAGRHFTNFIKSDQKELPHFDVDLDSLGREPGKVLRTTYSSQPDVIASQLDSSLIPAGFLRMKNYKDVTEEYWPTESFSSPLFSGVSQKTKIVYASIFNYGSWQAVWHGYVQGNAATFKKMSKGVVYMPMLYQKGKLIPAGWPYAIGYNNKMILKPDTVHTHTIRMNQQEGYLKYRSGKMYRLFYWNNKWVMVGQKIAPEGCISLSFDKVPKNALLIMVPEYSEYKERPFMITESGDRVWW